MAQIAQQDELRVEFTGGFNDMDDATKALLYAKKKQGIIYDVIIKSSTEGESRVMGVNDTLDGEGVVIRSEILVFRTSVATPVNIAIYSA